MSDPIRKRRSLIVTVFSSLLILGLILFFNFSEPDCVRAQTCVQITPQVHYWWTAATNWSSSQGCASFGFTSPSFGFPLTNGPPPNFAVALAGWDLEFTDNDHHWRRGRVRIRQSTITASGNSASFTLDVCLHDNDPDDPHLFQAYFLTFGWPQ